MEELIKRLERVIQTGAPDKDGMHPISAEAVLEVVKEQLGTNLAPLGTDLISRAAAQTELQLSARRYTVAHEAHGEGQVVWSESIISVSDAMDVLRKIPSAQPTFDARDTQYNLPIGTDLISRQQAIEVVQNRHMMLSKEKVLLINDLEKLPSAEPKRGRWIRTGSGSLYDHYECSECGKAPKWECMGDNRWKIAFTDFCPNCGAKMEVTT